MTDIGTIVPGPNDDVQFTTSPEWQGTPGGLAFNWTIDSGLAGELIVAADTQSAKLVTAPGDFTATIVVTDPASGVSDQATVERKAGVLTAIGLAAALVPKA